jgi:cytochrome c556
VILTKAFADVEAFWKGRRKDDAVKMAQTARASAQAIDSAAANSNWGDVKTHAATLAQQCSNCHGIYRERLEDGSFAIKRETR